jgi:hypothetical protein
MMAHRDYIIPIRLDDAEVPEVVSEVPYVDGRGQTPDHIAGHVERLLRLLPADVQAAISLKLPVHVAGVQADSREQALWLYEAICTELTVHALNTGALAPMEGWHDLQPWQLAAKLLRLEVITPELAARVYAYAVRHGRMLTMPIDLVANTIWEGQGIVQALRDVRQTFRRINHSPVFLFRDRALTEPYPIPFGVMLARVSERGKLDGFDLYPTHRLYHGGAFASPVFGPAITYDCPAYYHDLATGLAVCAFTDSPPTFIGWEYPAQWQVEQRFPDTEVGLRGFGNPRGYS